MEFELILQQLVLYFSKLSYFREKLITLVKNILRIYELLLDMSKNDYRALKSSKFFIQKSNKTPQIYSFLFSNLFFLILNTLVYNLLFIIKSIYITEGNLTLKFFQLTLHI